MSISLVSSIAGTSALGITAVNSGTGLTGGGDAGDIELDLDDTDVTPGDYTNANITVDQQGRITAAESGEAGGMENPIPYGTYLTGRNSTDTGDVTLVGVAGAAEAFIGDPDGAAGHGAKITVSKPNKYIQVETGTDGGGIVTGEVDYYTTVISYTGDGGGGATGATELQLWDASDNESVSIKAPDAVTSSYLMKLPEEQGGVNSFLKNDGSGNLEWAAGTNTSDFTDPVTVTLSGAGNTQPLQLLAPDMTGSNAMEVVIGKEYNSNLSMIFNERSTSATPTFTMSRWGGSASIAITASDVTIAALHASNGASGSFTAQSGETITVVDGIITAITP